MKVFLFALMAALGNALFVYGQRGAQVPENPFVFPLATMLVCTGLFLVSVLVSKAPAEASYVAANLRFVLISGVGFFITFIGFYWLYSQQGAVNYILYALLSILTTSIGVGLIIFKEPFNRYHVLSGILAVLAIMVYGLAQNRLPGQ